MSTALQASFTNYYGVQLAPWKRGGLSARLSHRQPLSWASLFHLPSPSANYWGAVGSKKCGIGFS